MGNHVFLNEVKDLLFAVSSVEKAGSSPEGFGMTVVAGGLNWSEAMGSYVILNEVKDLLFAVSNGEKADSSPEGLGMTKMAV